MYHLCGYMCFEGAHVFVSVCTCVWGDTCVWHKCVCTSAHGCGVKNVTLAVISQILSTFCWDKVSYCLGTCHVAQDDWPPSSREPPDSQAGITSALLCLAFMWFLGIKLISHASCTFLSHLQLPATEWRNFKYKIGWMPIQLHIAVLWVFRALCHRDLTSELFMSLQNQGCSTSKIKRGNWKISKNNSNKHKSKTSQWLLVSVLVC